MHQCILPTKRTATTFKRNHRIDGAATMNPEQLRHLAEEPADSSILGLLHGLPRSSTHLRAWLLDSVRYGLALVRKISLSGY